MAWKYRYDFDKLLEQYSHGWRRYGRGVVELIEDGIPSNKVLKLTTGWTYNAHLRIWEEDILRYENVNLFKGSDIFALELSFRVEGVGRGRGGKLDMYVANGKDYLHLRFFNNRVELQPSGVIIPTKRNIYNTVRLVKGSCGNLHVYLNSLKLFSRKLFGESDDNYIILKSEGESTLYLDRFYIHDGDKTCDLVRLDFPNGKGFEFPKLEPDPNDYDNIAYCGDDLTNSGGQGVTRTIHLLGTEPGRVVIEYNMGGVYPDKMEVYQGGKLLIDTRTVPGNTTHQYIDEDGNLRTESGFVLGEGTLEFDYNPAGGDIEVVIKGANNSSTSWGYKLNCPK